MKARMSMLLMTITWFLSLWLLLMLVDSVVWQMEPVLHQIRALMDHRRYDEIFALFPLLDLNQVRCFVVMWLCG